MCKFVLETLHNLQVSPHVRENNRDRKLGLVYIVYLWRKRRLFKLQFKVNPFELVSTSNAALSLVIRSIVVKNVIKLLIRMRNACLAWVGSPLKKVATFWHQDHQLKTMERVVVVFFYLLNVASIGRAAWHIAAHSPDQDLTEGRLLNAFSLETRIKAYTAIIKPSFSTWQQATSWS